MSREKPSEKSPMTLDAFEEVQRAERDMRERCEELGRELARLRSKMRTAGRCIDRASRLTDDHEVKGLLEEALVYLEGA
jgi:hypothetical protein